MFFCKLWYNTLIGGCILMEKREEQRYKNQLMVAYAKEILKHKNDGTLEKKPNSIDISDFELLHFSVSQLVFEQKD